MEDKETLYARWLSNEISDEEREFLRKDGAIDDLEKIIEGTSSLAVPKYDKVDGLKKLKANRPQKNSTSTSKYLFLAIGITIILLSALAIYFYINKNSSKTMIASHGNTENIELIDGSSISINDGSTITYNNKNWLEDRRIDLIGEAFFAVEKGSPFVVHSEHGSIEVLGTKFNVRAWGSSLSVECYEGSVKVMVDGKQTILSANEAIYVKNGLMKEKEIISIDSPLWEQGTSRFIDENVYEVFAEMERQYDVSIEIPKMSKQFSGFFRHDDLENALQNICKPLDLKYTISANKKIIIVE